MQATPTFAGIDWSWQHHALCIVDDDGQRIEEATVPHSQAGAGQDHHPAAPSRRASGRDRTRRRTGGRAPAPRRVRGRGDLGAAGEVAAGPLRIGGQQGRPVRCLRPGRRATHRCRPLGRGPARQRGDDRVADAGACPPRPDRPPDRGAQPAAGRAAAQLPRRDRTVQPARHRDQPDVPATVPHRSQSRLADRWPGRAADGALAQGQRLLRPPHARDDWSTTSATPPPDALLVPRQKPAR